MCAKPLQSQSPKSSLSYSVTAEPVTLSKTTQWRKYNILSVVLFMTVVWWLTAIVSLVLGVSSWQSLSLATIVSISSGLLLLAIPLWLDSLDGSDDNETKMDSTLPQCDEDVLLSMIQKDSSIN